MGDDGRDREGIKGGKDGEKRLEEGGRDRVGSRGRMGEGGGMREHERMRERERVVGGKNRREKGRKMK